MVSVRPLGSNFCSVTCDLCDDLGLAQALSAQHPVLMVAWPLDQWSCGCKAPEFLNRRDGSLCLQGGRSGVDPKELGGP